MTGVLTTGILSVAQLSLVAVRANRLARSTTFTTLLASQKMEQLQALAASAPVSNRLATSRPGALTANVDGFCDFLDAHGRTLGGGPAPPDSAAFVRRWSIDPLPLAAGDGLVMQVAVVPIVDDRSGAGRRLRLAETRIVGIRMR